MEGQIFKPLFGGRDVPKFMDVKKEYLDNVLRFFNGNKTKASIASGVSIRTIRNWSHRFFDSKDKTSTLP